MSDDRPGDLRQVVIQQLESLHRSGVRQLKRIELRPSTSPSIADRRPAAGLPLLQAAESVPMIPRNAASNSPDGLTSTPVSMSAARPSSRTIATGLPPPAMPGLTGMHANLPPIHTLPVLTLPDRQAALADLATEVAACTRCQELAASRTQTVFGVGNPQARLCFFGEAPGADEDRQGEPFVGRAGQLLTKIIEACTLTREDVYILNVLKCRPPGNRNPTGDEAMHCRPYFERQLEIIRPEFICCLGSIAATTLLETSTSIGRLRGAVHDWRGIKVVATYHPAYLLRNPAAKKYVWEDMQMLMKAMGISLPKP